MSKIHRRSLTGGPLPNFDRMVGITYRKLRAQSKEGKREKMVITRVWLDERKEDCTMCGLCQSLCPEVFTVPEKMVVREDADLNCQVAVQEAADSCPVNVIALEINHSGKRDNE